MDPITDSLTYAASVKRFNALSKVLDTLHTLNVQTEVNDDLSEEDRETIGNYLSDLLGDMRPELKDLSEAITAYDDRDYFEEGQYVARRPVYLSAAE